MIIDTDLMMEEDKIKLLLHIIDRLNKKKNRSGETHIQKLLFFLKNAKLLDFDIDYILYNYGPYSMELSDELRYMEEANLISKIEDSSGYGFNYIPNNEMEYVSDLIKKTRFEYQKIDELIDKFLKIPAKHLALLATFIYLKNKHEISDDNELIDRVMKIKPMFNVFEVNNTLERYSLLIKGDVEEFLYNFMN